MGRAISPVFFMLLPDRGAVRRSGISIGCAAVGLGAVKWRIFPRLRVESLLIVLRRLAISCALTVLVFPGIVRADDAEKDRAFAQLVREGDRARLAGQTPDAIAAYQKALDLREDTRIRGRLGLTYLDGHAPIKAASNLLPVIIDISGVPPHERREIKDAYDRARSAVLRIKIDVSHIAADVLIDGRSVRSIRDANSFYVFAAPGPHEVRATLAGHEDALATVDGKKGETVPVALVLKLIPPPPPPPAPIAHEKRNDTTATNPKPSYVVNPGPISVGAGVVALSGAISYLPALGPMAGVELHYGEWVSFRLDGRLVWSPQYEARRPVRGISFGGSLSGCANRSIYFGCIAVHVGGIGHSLETQNNPERVWNSRFGGGPIVGVVVPFYRELSVRVGGELMILQDGTRVLAGSNPYRNVVWSGPPFLGGFSLTLVWRPERRVLR